MKKKMLELPFRQNRGHVKERKKATAKHGPLHDLESVPKTLFYMGSHNTSS